MKWEDYSLYGCMAIIHPHEYDTINKVSEKTKKNLEIAKREFQTKLSLGKIKPIKTDKNTIVYRKIN